MVQLVITDQRVIQALNALAAEKGMSVEQILLKTVYKREAVIPAVDADEPYIDPLIKMAEFIERELGDIPITDT
ncbi:MAG: hypothetical protein SGJ24_02505 [Chloroflexota bacterium]|nr:hypothetical protein [Chloroflexota bacterium]